MSYRITLPGNRKAAARFVGAVRRRLLSALENEPGISQTDIARKLGVHRSVITRQLKGTSDMTIGRAAEIAWALGYRPRFTLDKLVVDAAANIDPKIEAGVVPTQKPSIRVGTTISASKPQLQRFVGTSAQLEDA